MPITEKKYSKILRTKDTLHLLLGNGFGLSLDHKRFNFQNLFDYAGLSKDTQKLAEKKLKTAPDFEGTLKILEDTKTVLAACGTKYPKKIDTFSDDLRDGLIRAVHKVHATGPSGRYITDFTAHQIEKCAIFLKTFQNPASYIFSLNYDLLLYRTLLEISNPNSSLVSAGLPKRLVSAGVDFSSWGDAFVTSSTKFQIWEDWATGPAPRICFLHGALHLFPYGTKAKKIKAINNYLFDEIDAQIKKGTLPLFVCEGSTEQKQQKIYSNAYLKDCIERLSVAEGKLIVFGCSLAKNDSHIWECIDKNKGLSKIFVGFHGRSNKSRIETAIQDQMPSKLAAKRIAIFDSSKVNLWS